MQVMWYEQAEGEAWLRKKEFGKALKKFTDTEKVRIGKDLEFKLANMLFDIALFGYCWRSTWLS